MATNSQGLTPQQMSDLATKQMVDRTNAQAAANPTQLAVGGQVGSLPGGTAGATPVTYQAAQSGNIQKAQDLAWAAQQSGNTLQQQQVIADRATAGAKVAPGTVYNPQTNQAYDPLSGNQYAGSTGKDFSGTRFVDPGQQGFMGTGMQGANGLPVGYGQPQSGPGVSPSGQVIDQSTNDTYSQILDQQQKMIQERLNATQQNLEQRFADQQRALRQQQTQEVGASSMQLARMGALGSTASGVSYLQKVNSSYDGKIAQLEDQKRSAILDAQNEADDKGIEFAFKRLDHIKEIQKEANDAKAQRMDDMMKYAQLQKLEKTDAQDTLKTIIDNGLSIDDMPNGYMEHLDEQMGLPEGSAEAMWELGMDEREKTNAKAEYKDQQEQYKANLDNAQKLQSILEKVPLGQAVKINGIEYTGLDRGDIKTGTETDANGNVTFWQFNGSDGKVSTTSLGTIGKTQDGWDTKFDDNGKPWRINAKTGQMVPFYPGQTQTDFQSTFPEGSVSPFKDANGNPRTQCGAFANDMTGIGVGDSFESKMAKMNLYQKGKGDPRAVLDSLQIGDCFTQKLGTWTGHIGMFGGYEQAPNGKIMIRAIESNYPQPGKITSTRLIPLEQIDGFGRGSKLSPLLQTGPDSQNTAPAQYGVGLPGQEMPTFGGKKDNKPLSYTELKGYGLDPTDPSNMNLTLTQAQAKRAQMDQEENASAPPPEKSLLHKQTFEEFASANKDKWETIKDAENAYGETQKYQQSIQDSFDAVKRGKFNNKDERAEFTRQADEAIKNGDVNRLESVMTQVGLKNMEETSRNKYQQARNLSEVFETGQDMLGSFANDPTFQTGNIKSIIENAKQKGSFDADPRYTQLTQLLATFQNEYRNSIAGASLTPMEKQEVGKAIVDPSQDTPATMWDKMEQGKKLQRFVADVRMADALGMPHPVIGEYLK